MPTDRMTSNQTSNISYSSSHSFTVKEKQVARKFLFPYITGKRPTSGFKYYNLLFLEAPKLLFILSLEGSSK